MARMKLENISRGEEIVTLLKKKGELTSAQVGDEIWGGSPSEVNWQRYARPAGKILSVLEKHGYVKKRICTGDSWYRTFWKAI